MTVFFLLSYIRHSHRWAVSSPMKEASADAQREALMRRVRTSQFFHSTNLFSISSSSLHCALIAACDTSSCVISTNFFFASSNPFINTSLDREALCGVTLFCVVLRLGAVHQLSFLLFVDSVLQDVSCSFLLFVDSVLQGVSCRFGDTRGGSRC